MIALTNLRRARIDEPIALGDGDGAWTMPPGEVYVEYTPRWVMLHAGREGGPGLVRVPTVEFHDWLARRRLVFLSWG